MLFYKQNSFKNLLRKIVLNLRTSFNYQHEHTRKYTNDESVLITYSEHTTAEGTIIPEIKDIRSKKKSDIYKVTDLMMFMSNIFRSKTPKIHFCITLSTSAIQNNSNCSSIL